MRKLPLLSRLRSHQQLLHCNLTQIVSDLRLELIDQSPIDQSVLKTSVHEEPRLPLSSPVLRDNGVHLLIFKQLVVVVLHDQVNDLTTFIYLLVEQRLEVIDVLDSLDQGDDDPAQLMVQVLGQSPALMELRLKIRDKSFQQQQTLDRIGLVHNPAVLHRMGSELKGDALCLLLIDLDMLGADDFIGVDLVSVHLEVEQQFQASKER